MGWTWEATSSFYHKNTHIAMWFAVEGHFILFRSGLLSKGENINESCPHTNYYYSAHLSFVALLNSTVLKVNGYLACCRLYSILFHDEKIRVFSSNLRSLQWAWVSVRLLCSLNCASNCCLLLADPTYWFFLRFGCWLQRSLLDPSCSVLPSTRRSLQHLITGCVCCSSLVFLCDFSKCTVQAC